MVKKKSLSALLSDFNGGCMEFSIKTKSEEDLDEPTSGKMNKIESGCLLLIIKY